MSRVRKVAPAQLQPWQMDLTKGVVSPVNSACIGVSENLEPSQVLDLAIDSGLEHICQRSGHFFDEEVRSANCIIESPESYRTFPIATILTPEDLNDQSERALLCMERHFDSSLQKHDVLTELNNAMQSKGLSQTIVEDIIAVSDELYTNAIFNAPFVDRHTQKNPGVSRNTSEVKLEGGKFARLFLAHDENRLLVGCEDPYGSLNLNRYLKKIRNTYQRGPAAAINFGPGGAGIGSYIIFNAGSSLYFGVWPGHVTIVCCLVPLGMSNRKRVQLAKHVHWIQR